MSEEKEIKNFNNLTKVDFKKKRLDLKMNSLVRQRFTRYYLQILEE